VLREHLAIDAHIDRVPLTLHANVGQILRIVPFGESRRILLSLFLLAAEFPTPMIGEGATPP
jgi:hypothetical protein